MLGAWLSKHFAIIKEFTCHKNTYEVGIAVSPFYQWKLEEVKQTFPGCTDN